MPTSTRLVGVLSVLLAASVVHAADSQPRDLLQASQRVLFLGDSITAAGPYVTSFESWLVTQRWDRTPLVINAGLPSETVSGLSEEGHAGGQFPRPDLAERLERVLAVTKPDLVIACYGMNCGIYQPFDETRFGLYQQGVRQLRSKVEKAGAHVILVTPPFYDDQQAPREFSYNRVLDRYSDWLLEQRASGWVVIDLHGPMTREVARRRAQNPKFTFQPDGVHPNGEGHWWIAQQLIVALGAEGVAKLETPEAMLRAQGVSETLLPLVQQRMVLRRDAYVSAAGHQRPGVARGMAVAVAEQRAEEISTQIRALLAP